MCGWCGVEFSVLKVEGVWCRVHGSGFGVEGAWCRVPCSGFVVEGVRCWVQIRGFKVEGVVPSFPMGVLAHMKGLKSRVWAQSNLSLSSPTILSAGSNYSLFGPSFISLGDGTLFPDGGVGSPEVRHRCCERQPRKHLKGYLAHKKTPTPLVPA